MYQVFKSKKYEDQRYIAENGEIFIIASVRSLNDYYEEVVKHGNEYAVQMMTFTTAKGNMFVVWHDVETEENFITKLATEDGEQ